MSGKKVKGSFEERVLKRLKDLDTSQSSIHETSSWLISQKDHHGKICETWFRQFRKADSAHRRVAFFYLANDVIQRSRKSGNAHFKQSFRDPLIQACAIMNQQHHHDAAHIQSVKHVLDTLKKRNIYKNSLAQMEKRLLKSRTKLPPVDTKTVQSNNAQTPYDPSQALDLDSSDESTDYPRPADDPAINVDSNLTIDFEAARAEAESSTIVETSDVSSMVELVKRLEKAPSGDAKMRERISQLPSEISDPTILDAITDQSTLKKLGTVVAGAC